MWWCESSERSGPLGNHLPKSFQWILFEQRVEDGLRDLLPFQFGDSVLLFITIRTFFLIPVLQYERLHSNVHVARKYIRKRINRLSSLPLVILEHRFCLFPDRWNKSINNVVPSSDFSVGYSCKISWCPPIHILTRCGPTELLRSAKIA